MKKSIFGKVFYIQMLMFLLLPLALILVLQFHHNERFLIESSSWLGTFSKTDHFMKKLILLVKLHVRILGLFRTNFRGHP